MILSKINLYNFRNYRKISLQLGQKMNILIGQNAQGKTNILEAISILSLTKSHRGGVEPNLIKMGEEKAILKARVKNNKILHDLEIELSNGNKKIKVDDSSVSRLADYISYLNIIIFTPDDLELIKGSPSVRRNFFNIELSQLSKTYLNTYNEYNKILKTRNEYLKLLFTSSIADKNYLDILTDKLVEKAVVIYQERKHFVDQINENLSHIFFDITGDKELKMIYLPNIQLEDFSADAIKNQLLYVYQKNYEKELNYKMTLYGPHRDDFSIYLNDIDLKNFGSQGQQRLAVLSTKLAEISIFERVCHTKPVLLLDDIFSELDLTKRRKLLKYINNDLQSIITTTDLKNIQKKFLEDANIYIVENGNISRK